MTSFPVQHSGAGHPRIAPLAPSGAKNARPGFPFTLSLFCEGFSLSASRNGFALS